MNHLPKIDQVIEIIRLEVSPENAKSFLEGRVKVDEFVSKLKGYLGTEILRSEKNQYLMLIRWDGEASVREAQQITETAAVISDWINSNAKFISFETTSLIYKNSL